MSPRPFATSALYALAAFCGGIIAARVTAAPLIPAGAGSVLLAVTAAIFGRHKLIHWVSLAALFLAGLFAGGAQQSVSRELSPPVRLVNGPVRAVGRVVGTPGTGEG